ARFEWLASIFPPELLALFEPNDKTNLAPYRIVHFVALSILVVRFVPADGALLRSRVLRPAIICGERSLEVF
ncbi:OpgC domain-containing protein, partial [Klebsiella pneumoniae]|nr:OpgC domain-containing protein [Klebsiella pneumoniae]